MDSHLVFSRLWRLGYEDRQTAKSTVLNHNNNPFGPTHFPPIRAGGGFRRDVARRSDLLSRRDTGGRGGRPKLAGKLVRLERDVSKRKSTESPIGGAVADTTRKPYNGQFPQWATFRRINGLTPYFALGTDGAEREEDSLLSYKSLSVGPIGQDIETMIGRLESIGFPHRVRTGKNPVNDIPRALLMVRGLRRARVPTKRKLPISVEDLMPLKEMIRLNQIGRQILRAAALIGWFFTLRANSSTRKTRPRRTGDIRSLFLTSPRCGPECLPIGVRTWAKLWGTFLVTRRTFPTKDVFVRTRAWPPGRLIRIYARRRRSPTWFRTTQENLPMGWNRFSPIGWAWILVAPRT